MPVASSLYRMANRLAGDRLDEILAELVAEKLSVDAIVTRLFADYGIEASRPTVAAWIAALPEPAEAVS